MSKKSETPIELGLRATARALGYSTKHTYELCLDGRLHGAKKLSGKWVIPVSAIRAFKERKALADQPRNYEALAI